MGRADVDCVSGFVQRRDRCCGAGTTGESSVAAADRAAPMSTTGLTFDAVTSPLLMGYADDDRASGVGPRLDRCGGASTPGESPPGAAALLTALLQRRHRDTAPSPVIAARRHLSALLTHTRVHIHNHLAHTTTSRFCLTHTDTRIIPFHNPHHQPAIPRSTHH